MDALIAGRPDRAPSRAPTGARVRTGRALSRALSCAPGRQTRRMGGGSRPRAPLSSLATCMRDSMEFWGAQQAAVRTGALDAMPSAEERLRAEFEQAIAAKHAKSHMEGDEAEYLSRVRDEDRCHKRGVLKSLRRSRIRQARNASRQVTAAEITAAVTIEPRAVQQQPHAKPRPAFVEALRRNNLPRLQQRRGLRKKLPPTRLASRPPECLPAHHTARMAPARLLVYIGNGLPPSLCIALTDVKK